MNVEYILRARDMLSPAFAQVSRVANTVQQNVSRVGNTVAQNMNRVGTQTRQAFNGATTAVNNLTGRNRLLSQSYDQIQARIRDVEDTVRTSRIPSEIRRARQELVALQQQASRHVGRVGSSSNSGGGVIGMLGGSLKGVAGSLGLALGAGALVSAGTGFVSESINKSLERQQIQTSFNVLAGSENRGGALTKQLVELQKDTILGSEVFQNAQTMMGFGFNSEEVYNNLKMLGDVSMGDAQKLGSLTLAFSQVRAGGKLLGNDLLQFINAGFNPLEVMAQRTGKSIGVLKDEMSQGLISFDMVQQAFKDATSEGGRFENMLGKIAETPAGKVQQLAGEWDEFKIQAGAAFTPLVSMALDLASKLLPIIERTLTPLANGVQNVVTWIKEAVSSTGGWMGYVDVIKNLFIEHLVPVIQKLWGLITNIVSRLFEFISSSELLKDIFGVIMMVYNKLYDVIGYVVDALSWVFDNIVMPILEGIEKAYRWIKGSGDEAKAVIKNNFGIKDKNTGINPDTLIQTSTASPAINSYNPSNSIKEVAASGSKPTNINIVLNKEMVGSITIYPQTASEGIDQMGDIVKQKLAEILNSGNRLAYD